jgi:hypothetical protein
VRRPARVAALACVTAWAVHAGVDWDWELTAVSIWVFGLAGVALASPAERSFAPFAPSRTLRLVVALGCLGLALSPALLWRSQDRLDAAAAAFRAGDCRATVDAALDSLAAVSSRPEPFELIAYCDVTRGAPELGVRAAEAGVARDPGSWELHYALAIVRGAAGLDPRPAAARALELNPLEERAAQAAEAFATDSAGAWQRRARRLPLVVE